MTDYVSDFWIHIRLLPADERPVFRLNLLGESVSDIEAKGRNRVVIFCLSASQPGLGCQWAKEKWYVLMLGDQEKGALAKRTVHPRPGRAGARKHREGKHKRCYSNWSNNSNRLLV